MSDHEKTAQKTDFGQIQLKSKSAKSIEFSRTVKKYSIYVGNF